MISVLGLVFDGAADLHWLGFSVHDSFHTKSRQVLFDTWVECQLWSLEDQIAFPFSLFYNQEINSTKNIPVDAYMQLYLGVPPGDAYREGHATRTYGK